MRTQLITIIAAVTLVGMHASAEAKTSKAEEANVSAAAAEAKAGQDKKICKRLPTTGSRMAPRACHTREEWKKLEGNA